LGSEVAATRERLHLPAVPVLLLTRVGAQAPSLQSLPNIHILLKPVPREKLRITLAEILRLQPAHTGPDRRSVKAKFEGLRVLVAEDNEINQTVAESLLTGMGCVVEVAPNGAEAVELVRSGRFDLVLMDCQMPVMDGFEATRR